MRRKRASHLRGCHHETSFQLTTGLGPLAEAGLTPIVATMKLFTALLCVLSLSLGVHAAAPDEFPAITHQELTAAMKAKAVTVIDVNGTASFKNGRIPGAIDYASLRGGLAGVLPKDKGALVVAYCGNEKCQAYRTAAKAVAALGYTNVKHYAPGIAGWRASGASIEKGAE